MPGSRYYRDPLAPPTAYPPVVPPTPKISWDDPQYYPCRCPVCNWVGMSNETAGGQQIADTGDYADPVCPKCIAPNGDHEQGRWIPVEEIPKPVELPPTRKP